MKPAWLWWVVFLSALGSLIHPHDLLTWLLEAFPTLFGLMLFPLLARRGYRLTPLLYHLIALHGLILLLGAHYTYARVPLFEWLKPIFGFERNHYDRLGHLAQGFVPVMLAREWLLRGKVVRGKYWLGTILLLSVLGISAAYELFEFLVAIASNTGADDFLGTQGDPWDTQKDMLCAFIGAAVALCCLSNAHDRALARLRSRH